METVSAETQSTAQLKDVGSSSKSTGGQFAWQAETEETKSLLRLWLGNFCLEISTFPDPYFRESSAFKEEIGGHLGFDTDLSKRKLWLPYHVLLCFTLIFNFKI